MDDQSGLISVLGGKWTTYRQMSEDAVDAALAAQPALRQKALGACVTKSVPLVGAAGWSLACPRALAAAGYADDVAAHLSHNYGYLAYAVADLGLRRGLSARLAPDYPFVEAEVVFGVQSEHAVRAGYFKF